MVEQKLVTKNPDRNTGHCSQYSTTESSLLPI
jgi:hypothetical protein